MSAVLFCGRPGLAASFQDILILLEDTGFLKHRKSPSPPCAAWGRGLG